MTATEEQRRVKALLEETIVLLCKNGLDFKSEFTVEALIGITLDKKDVILISIKETIQNDPLREKENDNMANDCTSLVSNTSVNNSSGLDDDEFNYNVEFNPPTSSGSLNNPPHDFDFIKVAGPPQTKSHHIDSEECSSHMSYSLHSGNNENSQPFSHPQTSVNRNKRTFQTAYDSNSCNDNHNTSGTKEPKSKFHKVAPKSSGEVIPLSSHNATTASTMRNMPLNIQICKSEPPDYEELSSAMRDTFGGNANNNAQGNLNMKWQTDEFLSDLSNMVHGTGLGRPSISSGKDGCIEGIGSLLNLPIQHSSHLPPQIPPTMSATNAAMNLASPPFLESSAVRPGHSQGQASGSRARYKCNLCFKEVRLLRDLRAHMATKHNLEKDFSCSVCGTGFTYKHNLFVHLRTVHRLNDRPTAPAIT